MPSIRDSARFDKIYIWSTIEKNIIFMSTLSLPSCLSEVLFEQTNLPTFLKEKLTKEEFFQKIEHEKEKYLASCSFFFYGQIKMIPMKDVKSFVHKDVQNYILDHTTEDVSTVRDYEEWSSKFQTERIDTIFSKEDLLFISNYILPIVNKEFEFHQNMTFGDKKYRVLLHFYGPADKHDVKEAVMKLRKIHLLKFLNWIRENE